VSCGSKISLERCSAIGHRKRNEDICFRTRTSMKTYEENFARSQIFLCMGRAARTYRSGGFVREYLINFPPYSPSRSAIINSAEALRIRTSVSSSPAWGRDAVDTQPCPACPQRPRIQRDGSFPLVKPIIAAVTSRLLTGLGPSPYPEVRRRVSAF